MKFVSEVLFSRKRLKTPGGGSPIEVVKNNLVSLGFLSILLLILPFFMAGCGFFNEPPKAKISADTMNDQSPLEVSFDGSGSSDPDGSIESYSWDFGDGEESSEVSPTHTFTNDTDSTIEYDVTLNVTDDMGESDTAEVTITVLVPPTPP